MLQFEIISVEGTPPRAAPLRADPGSTGPRAHPKASLPPTHAPGTLSVLSYFTRCASPGPEMGREDRDRASDEEPEVEDVEADGLLPPLKHVHDYRRVEHELCAARREDAKRLRDLPAGLCNSGNTCFAASALQCLYHTRLLTAHFADEPHPHDSCETPGFCVTCEYQKHVLKALDAEPRGSFSIGKLTNAIGSIAKHFVRGRQEDSHEYIRGLLDGIHVQALKEFAGEKAEKELDARTQETTIVHHIFGGYTCGQVECIQCGHVSRNYQSMIDIPVEVTAKSSSGIEASLKSNFLDTEILDGSNKYKCARCRAYVRAEKGGKIHVSPNVLVVPLKRYTMGRFSKITKFVEFPATLDLTPYMSRDAPYEGKSPPTYTLYGVVVHLDWGGSAHSGHYVSYVRLLDGRWCKCDDGRVETCDESAVLKQKAYLLFYERDAVRPSCAPTRTRSQQLRVERLVAEREARDRRVRARREAAKSSGSASRLSSGTSGTSGVTHSGKVTHAPARDSDDDDASSDGGDESDGSIARNNRSTYQGAKGRGLGPTSRHSEGADSDEERIRRDRRRMFPSGTGSPTRPAASNGANDERREGNGAVDRLAASLRASTLLGGPDDKFRTTSSSSSSYNSYNSSYNSSSLVHPTSVTRLAPVERDPRVNIDDRRDGYGRGSIVVEVELPGVASAKEVDAEFTDPSPVRSVLHVRVPGKYKADIRLPAKIDGDKALGASFSSRKQRITFTLPVS